MKYHVTGSVVGSKYLGTYEAETPEQAVEMAMEAHGGPISLCHQCNDECSDGEVQSAQATPSRDVGPKR